VESGVTFYLSSPGNQMHADHLAGMPVLVSYAIYPRSKKRGPWLDDYVPTFQRLLVDSGAFSEFNSGVKVDGLAYRDWCQRWDGVQHVDAIAGLDDIAGDWRRSLNNYEQFGGFPTMHETDPPELLDDLIPIARERGNWLGLGLIPPRVNKWGFVRSILDRVPDGIHVHVWAGGEYCGHPRVDSVDSTNWFSDSMKYRNQLPFLTYAECVDLVVKRYQRAPRKVYSQQQDQVLFS
jgi:hypothetical protein